jgi:hypothetical protein
MNRRSLAVVVACFGWVLALWPTPAHAEGFAVPDLPPRGDVGEDVAGRFVEALRRALAERGLRVTSAPLITAGIAGSLEPDFAVLIAQLEGTRYALTGEVVGRDAAEGPFAVDVLAVDVLEGRASDLISRAFDLATLEAVAGELALALSDFAASEPALPPGDAGLFVSTDPRGAEVRVGGIVLGRSGAIDLVGLAPGRYEVEVRLDGYLPEVRTLDLRGGDTSFLHVELTAIVGGSLQVVTRPSADVYVDGVRVGTSPLTIDAAPGERRVELRRPGFGGRVLTVPVRGFRVTRVELDLEPLGDPVLVWRLDRAVRVFVDGVQQPAGYALPEPGLRTIEVVVDGAVRRWLRAIPESGVLELDLDGGELRPLNP